MKIEENVEENEEELCMIVEDIDDMVVIIFNEDCVEIVNFLDVSIYFYYIYIVINGEVFKNKFYLL